MRKTLRTKCAARRSSPQPSLPGTDSSLPRVPCQQWTVARPECGCCSVTCSGMRPGSSLRILWPQKEERTLCLASALCPSESSCRGRVAGSLLGKTLALPSLLARGPLLKAAPWWVAAARCPLGGGAEKPTLLLGQGLSQPDCPLPLSGAGVSAQPPPHHPSCPGKPGSGVDPPGVVPQARVPGPGGLPGLQNNCVKRSFI